MKLNKLKNSLADCGSFMKTKFKNLKTLKYGIKRYSNKRDLTRSSVEVPLVKSAVYEKSSPDYQNLLIR